MFNNCAIIVHSFIHKEKKIQAIASPINLQCNLNLDSILTLKSQTQIKEFMIAFF
jgi:hypothetical protein